ncbi:bifunctional DNA primase/polymerase [Deinococcus sp. S9]|uniref:bifunctional DNA primase/polymerase n=1 Tax=Deinococcus sp. S9 TaxID=2545754 RepID=UPI001056B4E1|nr:bifunctional DNA primase/polymerase [Deinococcus sp. S9]TDE85595.1 bifunctional DNA primase/polymerase [Deinococcus sp. S9]
MTTTYDPALMLRRADYYLRLGMALTPVEWGGKLPVFGKGWNREENLIRGEAAARQWFARPHNIGVHLGRSGIVSLDIDDLDLAVADWEKRGLDLVAFVMEHPHVILGRGVRLWFRAPENCAVTSRRHLSVGGVCAYELRGGDGFQDVAPGSLHPEGYEYRWAEAVPRRREDLPELPQFLQDLYVALGEKPQTAPKKPQGQPIQLPGGGIIDRFNATVTVEEILERNGYVRRGDRYLGPSSHSGRAGVEIYTDDQGKTRARTHHTSDLWCDGHGHDAFSLFAELEHGGDFKAALNAARELLGLPARPGFVTPQEVAARWDARLEETLGAVMQGLAETSLNHNAQASLWRLTEYLYGEAAFGNLKYIQGCWCVMVGGVRGIAEAGVGGHPRDISARLKFLSEIGLLLNVRRVDDADPYSPLMIPVPADPAELPFLRMTPEERAALDVTLNTKGTRRAARKSVPAGTPLEVESGDSPPTTPSEATPGGRVRLLSRLLRPVLAAVLGKKKPAKHVREALEAEGLPADYRALKAELRRERDCDVGVRFALINRLELARDRLRHVLRLARFGVAAAREQAPRARKRLSQVTERLERLRDGEPMSLVMRVAA